MMRRRRRDEEEEEEEDAPKSKATDPHPLHLRDHHDTVIDDNYYTDTEKQAGEDKLTNMM